MHSQLGSLFTGIPFFEGLTEEDVKQLSKWCVERKFKRRSIIFLEGDVGDELYIIKKGSVEICHYYEDKKNILTILHEGNYFGEMALLQKGSSRSATAEAIETTSLYALRREDFARLLESNPKLMLNLLENTMDRLRQANELIHDLTFLNVRLRLNKLLVRLIDQFGSHHPKGMLINFKLTHQQIAELIGAARVTVTKLMLELQDEGIIEILNKKILVIDLEQLKEDLFI
ncbi:Crp/Fnr family transcriptional regulator [Bacillus sp. Marseille-P3661]|uniref:Crp/Fnr family transcriptional regulator n=1 Tax=Bacillus sp. Marseille-P3661 TaxID=1936234 RepID=UPI000C8625B5|nr:Crp/Fnr family transcriptional regulator [Bacillus sp. Marseille-P3661]